MIMPTWTVQCVEAMASFFADIQFFQKHLIKLQGVLRLLL